VRLPTYEQHRRFCEVDDWQDKDAVSKKKGGDHHRYVKVLPNGRGLFTRVSRGSGQYRNHDFWRHILREQLEVTEGEFWAAVESGIPPSRPRDEPAKPKGEAIPLSLVNCLRYVMQLSEREIASMTRAEAERVWQEWQESLSDQDD
jgi:hypothetical protein